MKQKKIILWDLHEVLFTRSLWRWLYLAITYPKKWRVLRSLDWHILHLCFRYFLHVTHIKRAELCSQELIDYAQKKKLHELIALTITVACDYTPIPETISLLETLHHKGYTQHVGSNVGQTVYDHFRPQHQTIFNHFSAIHIVRHNGCHYIKKPNPQFFIDYLTKYNLQPKDIVFIDDKLYNIKAAQALGIYSIQYKNSAQLKSELSHIISLD